MIAPGGSIIATIQFCPRDTLHFDTTITAFSNLPCLAMDTGTLKSFGYAPPFPFKMVLSPDVMSVDSVGGRIADTIEVPVLIDRAIATPKEGPLTPLDIRFDLTYNPRSLQYLDITSPYVKPVPKVNLGALSFTLPGCQNVAKGEIARVKFLVTVPDSVTTSMTLTPGVFTSDSLMFIRPVPIGDTSVVSVGPRCNISKLVFHTGTNSISAPRPNPASGKVSLDLSFIEDANPELQIFNSVGDRVLTLMDGNAAYQGGSYHVGFDARKLAAGVYYVEFHAGEYRAAERMVVVK
jgi:hypothetical protein